MQKGDPPGYTGGHDCMAASLGSVVSGDPSADLFDRAPPGETVVPPGAPAPFAAPPFGAPAPRTVDAFRAIGTQIPTPDASAVHRVDAPPAWDFATVPDVRSVMVYAIVAQNGTTVAVGNIHPGATWAEVYRTFYSTMPKPGEAPREYEAVPVNSQRREQHQMKKAFTVTSDVPELVRMHAEHGAKAPGAPAAHPDASMMALLRESMAQTERLARELLAEARSHGTERVAFAESTGREVSSAYVGILEEERKSASKREDATTTTATRLVDTGRDWLQAERDRNDARAREEKIAREAETTKELARIEAAKAVDLARIKEEREAREARLDREERAAAAERKDRADRQEREDRARAEAAEREENRRTSHALAMETIRVDSLKVQMDSLADQRDRNREHLTTLAGLLRERASGADPLTLVQGIAAKFGIDIPSAWTWAKENLPAIFGGGGQTVGVALVETLRDGIRGMVEVAKENARAQRHAGSFEDLDGEQPDDEPADEPARPREIAQVQRDRALPGGSPPAAAPAPPPPAAAATNAWGGAIAPPPAPPVAATTPSSAWGAAAPQGAVQAPQPGVQAPAAPAPAPAIVPAPAPAPAAPPPAAAAPAPASRGQLTLSFADQRAAADAIEDLVDQLESAPESAWMGAIMRAMSETPALRPYVSYHTLEGVLRNTAMDDARVAEIVRTVERSGMVAAQYLWLDSRGAHV